jgi:hypothetical protein
VLGAEEASAQTVDRLARQACAFGQLFPVRVHDIRNAAHGARSLALKVRASTSRPQQHHGADRRPGREAPTLEAVRNRGVRRRNRHWQDERENGPARGSREVTAERAGEEGREADGRHRCGAEPRASGAQSPDCDERGADAPEPEIREEASPRRPSELGQYEHRERSEGREDRRLRLPDHLVREREDRRHDDRGARGAFQRCEVRHAWR